MKLEKSENAANAKEIIKNDEALFKPPSIVQLAAHAYFPASFMVGPQFGIKRYMNFVTVTENFVWIRFVDSLRRILEILFPSHTLFVGR